PVLHTLRVLLGAAYERSRVNSSHREHLRRASATVRVEASGRYGKWGNRGSIAAMNNGRDRVERRLMAVLAADVAGYSRLMGADEEGTHAALTVLRRELVDPKIAEHRGRIVKTTGDGLLVEFASVVDAVRCAVEFQREMAQRNDGMPQE